jgi:hypothetical protein
MHGVTWPQALLILGIAVTGIAGLALTVSLYEAPARVRHADPAQPEFAPAAAGGD